MNHGQRHLVHPFLVSLFLVRVVVFCWQLASGSESDDNHQRCSYCLHARLVTGSTTEWRITSVQLNHTCAVAAPKKNASPLSGGTVQYISGNVLGASADYAVVFLLIRFVDTIVRVLATQVHRVLLFKLQRNSKRQFFDRHSKMQRTTRFPNAQGLYTESTIDILRRRSGPSMTTGAFSFAVIANPGLTAGVFITFSSSLDCTLADSFQLSCVYSMRLIQTTAHLSKLCAYSVSCTICVYGSFSVRRCACFFAVT